MPQGFAGGPLVKNPPANAGDMDSIPTQGAKIPHAKEQQSLCSTTTEPMRWNPRATITEPTCFNYWNPHTLEPVLHKSSLHNEKPT